MFKNLRRNSKQLFEPKRKTSVTTTVTPVHEADSVPSRAGSRKLTFFDLPAEIRNVIYEHVARDTRLYNTGKKPNKSPLPVPSMLLVSGQTRREYLPLLLEFAPIAFRVKDFDFKSLMRITSSLYSTELKALRHNPNLTLRLQVSKPSRDTMASLRRWLVKRAENLDRLAWSYGVIWAKHVQILPTSSEVHKTNTYIQRRTLLTQNLEMMAQLHRNVDETLRFELEPIIAAFEEELARVAPDPPVSWRDENALMLYGIRMRSSVH